ncbi:MAG TPA: large conductance mechanosensitive channel protein MscL [Pusillimonas sp.]|uniref:large conductance mechanosensitive channel protein MscL n=1 Tax=Pusillimonas sp. TaxID=3040095 RepID=UPI002BECBB42|nr:large conductance mechanosensitive channel protein MscL [Pusillimonas sp.]HUH88424.1 large conductance mechanosensitive channel protein MscL [Pusillimonas sp.]
MNGARGFLAEFREFAVKGNMIDLAVGVIIGAAFGKIIDSLVKDVIMPIISFILGGQVDFTNLFWVLKEPQNYTGPRTYEAIVEAGGNVLAWGNFITIFINFLLLALVVFFMVKAVNRARKSFEREEAVGAPPPQVTPDDILLLREIRDLLKK